MSKTKQYILYALPFAAILLLFGAYTYTPPRVQAADNDFSNGITVDSTGDGADANTSDSICDDGSGNCTLRAAIEESNDEAGTQTIRFNITGTADFTNGGQNGYTIQPQSALPNITDTVVIDGYTQPGSQANTAVAPQPLNGILLIEVDGGSAGNVNGLTADADNSAIRGLVINNFSASSKSGITVGSHNLTVQGSYIGTEPDGMTAAGNDGGIMQGADNSTGAQIGGLDPEDRNIISGNISGGSSPNTGSDNWTYQGNYIGVARDGLTAVPNAQPNGSGALSLDNSDGHIVGGPEVGATNVISGNRGHGIAPHNSDDLLIEGNYIGVGYDGITDVGNGTAATVPGTSGIQLSECSNSMVINNMIANNKSLGGINHTQSNGGIFQGNTITNNNGAGVVFSGSSNALIGGEQSGESNIIAHNNGPGVGIIDLFITNIPATIPSIKNSIIGNAIYDNSDGELQSLPMAGAGIDLATLELVGFVPQVFAGEGVSTNDPSDPDTGPNNYINFPVINTAEQDELSLNLNLDLDVADSPTDEYRVEIFANDTADPSGYGEGQTFLGYANLSAGSNQGVNITLPTGTNLTGKVLSATTTAIDSTTDSGFGSTSEFSLVSDVDVIALPQGNADTGTEASLNNGTLANTGQNVHLFGLLGLFLAVSAFYLVKRSRSYTYIVDR